MRDPANKENIAYIRSGFVLTKEQTETVYELAKMPIDIDEELLDRLNSIGCTSFLLGGGQMANMTVTMVGSLSKNIIFLDIDGVLNGYNKWNLLGWKIVCLTKSKRLKCWYTKLTNPYGVHERKVKRLAKIVRATNAKVVMSSSWRFGWWNTPYEKQSKNQKKLTDLLNKYNIEVIDITPDSPDGRRDKEIMEWLAKHEDMVRRFVILDDERYDLECFVDSHLVQTSLVDKGEMIMGYDREDTGLKNKHVKKAIEILRK